ncbi:MAG: hypothetical protein AB7O59_21085, partial [Pirellulales bacterium]
VQVLATTHTGLATPDVFFFGNRIGDTGSPTATSFTTTTGDASTITAGGLGPAGGITNVRDIDKSNTITVAGDRSAALGNIGALNRLNVGTGGPFAPEHDDHAASDGYAVVRSALAVRAIEAEATRPVAQSNRQDAVSKSLDHRAAARYFEQLSSAASEPLAEIGSDAATADTLDYDEELLSEWIASLNGS